MQHEWQECTAELSTRDIGPRAEEYDRKAACPRKSLHALRDAGLWSMRVPHLHAAAAMADAGWAPSVLPFMQAKVLCAEVGVRGTAELMTMFGGTACAGRLPFERYLRDARAGLVMGVANDASYDTIGTLLFPAHASDAEPSRAPTS